jgi:hypothetical protein
MAVSPIATIYVAAMIQQMCDPDADTDGEHHGEDDDDDQRRVFDPGDGRNGQCHDQTQAAHLPGKHLQARGKGAERQQGEDRERGRIGGKTSLHARQQQHVHHHDEGEPVQRLRADQSQPRRSVGGARPSGADTDQRDQRRQQLPETDDRLLGKSSYRRG